MKRLPQLLVPAVAVLLSGCYDTKQSYEINPDGSGRVTFETLYQPISLTSSSEEIIPEARARKEAREILENSKGVEAWEDVRAEAMPDNKVRIRGTAYFRDLNRFKLHNIVQQQIRLANLPDGSLRISPARSEGSGKIKPSTTDPATMDLAAEVTKYKQARPMLESFLGTMRDELTVAVPGKADPASTMKTGTSGLYTVLFDGKAILKATDEVMGDESRLKAFLAEGGSMDPQTADNPAMDRLIYGRDEPDFVIVRPPLRALFDHASNVKRAKANNAALMESLGLPAYLEPDSTNEIALVGVDVAGVRLARIVDQDNRIHPFGQSDAKTPLGLSIVASLPGAVSEVAEVQLLTAVSTSGEDLMPDEEYRRKISFPRLSKDRSKISFDLDIKRPSSLSAGLREVSGEILVLMQKSMESVDLGFPALTNGAVGKVYNATLGIEESGSKVGDKTLIVRFDLDAKLMEGVDIVDAAGNTIKPTSSSSSFMNEKRTMRFSGPPWPTDARIVARVRKDVIRQPVPFKVENISLLGEPLAP